MVLSGIYLGTRFNRRRNFRGTLFNKNLKNYTAFGMLYLILDRGKSPMEQNEVSIEVVSLW